MGALRHGADLLLVRIWPGGDRRLEWKLKHKGTQSNVMPALQYAGVKFNNRKITEYIPFRAITRCAADRSARRRADATVVAARGLEPSPLAVRWPAAMGRRCDARAVPRAK
jgi:hypothetical protein